MDSKKPWLSKTVWLNAIVSLVGVLSSFGVLPGLQSWIASNSDLLLAGLGLIGIVLRAVSKGKLELK